MRERPISKNEIKAWHLFVSADFFAAAQMNLLLLL
jgi:hypothetical protein